MLQWTLECIYLFKLVLLFSLGKYPKVKLLTPMEVLFLIFWRTSILFSIVAAPVNNVTNSDKFFFLHILTNTCYLLSFWWKPFWQVWDGTSLWFWFTFLWWLVMLSIFLRVCWLFVCLLWKNVYSNLCPF